MGGAPASGGAQRVARRARQVQGVWGHRQGAGREQGGSREGAGREQGGRGLGQVRKGSQERPEAACAVARSTYMVWEDEGGAASFVSWVRADEGCAGSGGPVGGMLSRPGVCAGVVLEEGAGRDLRAVVSRWLALWYVQQCPSYGVLPLANWQQLPLHIVTYDPSPCRPV